MISTCIFALYLQTTKMNRFFFFATFLLSSGAFGQSMVDKVLKDARALSSQYKEPEALIKYKQVLAFDMNHYEATWNCSLLSARVGKRELDKAKQKDLYLVSKSYALKALNLNSGDVQSNYVMAVAMGRIALISDTKEKIAAVREIKKYAEKAVELGPKHAGANHVLAVWNLEVSELNWVERQVADKFFGGLPEASLDRALEWCKKAVEYDPNYILYQLDLGRIYKLKGDKANAKKAYQKVGIMSSLTLDDPGYQTEAKKILETL